MQNAMDHSALFREVGEPQGRKRLEGDDLHPPSCNELVLQMHSLLRLSQLPKSLLMGAALSVVTPPEVCGPWDLGPHTLCSFSPQSCHPLPPTCRSVPLGTASC